MFSLFYINVSCTSCIFFTVGQNQLFIDITLGFLNFFMDLPLWAFPTQPIIKKITTRLIDDEKNNLLQSTCFNLVLHLKIYRFLLSTEKQDHSCFHFLWCRLQAFLLQNAAAELLTGAKKERPYYLFYPICTGLLNLEFILKCVLMHPITF